MLEPQAAWKHMNVNYEERMLRGIGVQPILFAQPTVTMTRSHAHMELMIVIVKKLYFVEQKVLMVMVNFALEFAPQPAKQMKF